MEPLCKKTRNHRARKCIPDRLSPLPDDILHHIMSFVDVLDSVRTSVLSRRWMNVWLSAPWRNFSMSRYIEHYDGSKEQEKLGARNKFWKFINWVLVTKVVGPVRRISLSFDDTMVDKINALLLLAAKLEVQEICLSGGDYDDRVLMFPGALCETLTSLTIDFRDRIHFRAGKFFCRLRNLYLRGVALSDNTVEKLFSCDSTYLEDVHLEGCHFKTLGLINIYGNNLKNLTIANIYCFSDAMWIVSFCKYSLNVCAPNLVSFTYIGPMLCSFDLSKSKSLKRALFRIMHASQRYSNKYNLLACPLKFVGLDPSESLTLSSLVVKHSSPTHCDIRMGDFILDNLKSLKVGLRYNVDYLDGLSNLLWVAPKLEALIVRFREDRRRYWPKGNQEEGSLAIGAWKPEIHYISCLSRHLKRVKISCVNSSTIALELVSYLLQKGKVLEKVEILFRGEDRKRKVFCELVDALPKASQRVTIYCHVVPKQREFNWFQHGDSDPEYE